MQTLFVRKVSFTPSVSLLSSKMYYAVYLLLYKCHTVYTSEFYVILMCYNNEWWAKQWLIFKLYHACCHHKHQWHCHSLLSSSMIKIFYTHCTLFTCFSASHKTIAKCQVYLSRISPLCVSRGAGQWFPAPVKVWTNKNVHKAKVKTWGETGKRVMLHCCHIRSGCSKQRHFYVCI